MRIFRLSRVACLFGTCLGFATALNAEESILSTVQTGFTASSEIEAFVCSFNEEGGMITEIIRAALTASGQPSDPALEFVSDPLTVDLAGTARSGRIVFPMYKPRCDEPSLLNDHTAELCRDLVWSDPVFHVVMSGYVASDQEWVPTGNSQLIGRTICQPHGQSAFYLRERGISDLNARVVEAPSPTACLRHVAAGGSDVAILPMLTATTAIKKAKLADAVRYVETLDTVLSVHAIASSEMEASAESIAALNRGLESIRAKGEWFEIVKEHIDGHSHGQKHAAHISN